MFLKVPLELLLYIIKDLDLPDILHLSQACKHFEFLRNEESICKLVLEDKAPSSLETEHARQGRGGYALQLRRLLKRRKAIEENSPFLISLVALTDQHVYCNGTLLYILEQDLRILDLQNTDTELVVSIPDLVAQAVPSSRGSKRYKFKVIHYAHGIVSCLYTHARPDTKNWLVVFRLREGEILPRKGEILTCPELTSAFKIFVRNTKDYLFFGTQSDIGEDGFRRWVIKGYDICNDTWWDKMRISNVIGSELGSTICFEIIDNYFYGISNQTTFAAEEIDWTSVYYCFRFSLDQEEVRHGEVEELQKERAWRRQHKEGVIDDRWSFLSLERDEDTGKLLVVESRKEWLRGGSEGRRTYYSKELRFDSDDCEESDTTASCTSSPDIELPNDQLRRLIDDTSKPNFLPGQIRPAVYVHRGDDPNTWPTFTLTKSPLRTYFPSTNTFLDMVDDPHRHESAAPQRLRLRTGHRRRLDSSLPIDRRERPLSLDEEDCIAEYTDFEISKQYSGNQILYWPPDNDPTMPDERLNDLQTLMNPVGYTGAVTGTSDSRNIIYSTGGDANGVQRPILSDSNADPRALVLISYDCRIRLRSAQKWKGGLPGSPYASAGTSRKGKEVEGGTRSQPNAPDTTPYHDQGHPQPVRGMSNVGGGSTTFARVSWCEEQPALHLSLELGFDFTK